MSIRKISLISLLALSSSISALLFANFSQTEVQEEELVKLEARPLMSQETQRVIEMLETIHFRNEEIEDETFSKLVKEYMDHLDFNRLFFLQENLEANQEAYGTQLSHQLRTQGDLTAAFEIFDQYRTIALDRSAWVLDLLKNDWTFEEDEIYQYDRTESDWPSNKEEADSLWIKRLKNELIQEILTEKTLEEAEETITKRYERMRRNILELSASDVQEAFLTQLTHMFDPHSTFFSSDTFDDFNIQMRLSLEGIGAILSEEDGYCTIKELVAGGPAKRSGRLNPNDRIVAVAQGDGEAVDIVGMSLSKVVKQIRGEKGSIVNLTIIPADAPDSELEIVEIERDSVRIDSSRCDAKLYNVPADEGKIMPIGVISIPTFYGSVELDEAGNRRVTSVSADVEELTLKLVDAGAEAIVLDLRMNGGGLLDEAIAMTGLFIDRGPVVQVKEPYGRVSAKSDRNPKVIYTGPLAVLTNRYSASASEIVAGALQNYGRAIVIGNDSTHGKGTVQTVISLENYVINAFNTDEKAGATKLTIQKFYLPNGFSTQRKGVSSDIRIPSIDEIFAEGEAELPNALSWDFVKPARFSEMNLKKTFVEELLAESEVRRNQLEEFQFLNKRLDWYKEREERTEISVNLETRKSLKETEKAFIDEMEDAQRQLAILNFEEIEFTLDGVEVPEEEEEVVAAVEDKEDVIEEDATEVVADVDAPSEESSTDEATEESTEVAATIEDEEEEKEDVPPFDIQLRETLRIMVDAIDQSPNPSEWVEVASPIAFKNRFELVDPGAKL